jgi:20S proteasome alpha/beta subunit
MPVGFVNANYKSESSASCLFKNLRFRLTKFTQEALSATFFPPKFKCRFDPLWNSLVIGGIEDGKPFLGTVGMIGTCYSDVHIATGEASYNISFTYTLN